MSFFGSDLAELPIDAEFSAGARTSFGEGFSAAYEDQYRSWSAYGLQFDFAQIEGEQLNAIYEATGERMAPLFTMPTFKTMARKFQGEELSAHENEQMAALQERFDRVAQIKRNNPSVLTYEEMWGQVQSRAKAAEERAQRADSLSGFGGGAGAFLGRMAGSFTTRDPLNLLTLGIGGVGRGIIMRLGTEFGANALVEAVNQVTGVQENRQLLELEHGADQAALQIAFAGLGAATLRGVGEGLGAGARAVGRRVRKPTPPATAVRVAQVVQTAEEALGPAPHGTSRTARGAHVLGVEMAVRSLDTPLFEPVPLGRADMLSTASPVALAARSSDALFAGTAEPVSKVIADLHTDNPAFAKIIAKVDDEVRKLNRQIAKADGASDAQAKALAEERAKADPAEKITALRGKIAALEQQIAEVETLGIGARKKKQRTQRLTKERDELAAVVAKADQVNAQIEAMAAQHGKAASVGDDLRIRRAQVIEQAKSKLPASQHDKVDKRAILHDLTHMTPPENVPVRLVREFVEKIDEAQKVLDEAEQPTPKPIPKLENTPEDAPEMVDLGTTDPVDLETEIIVDLGDGETPRTITVRQALEEMADDDALVKQSKECLL